MKITFDQIPIDSSLKSWTKGCRIFKYLRVACNFANISQVSDRIVFESSRFGTSVYICSTIFSTVCLRCVKK